MRLTIQSTARVTMFALMAASWWHALVTGFVISKQQQHLSSSPIPTEFLDRINSHRKVSPSHPHLNAAAVSSGLWVGDSIRGSAFAPPARPKSKALQMAKFIARLFQRRLKSRDEAPIETSTVEHEAESHQCAAIDVGGEIEYWAHAWEQDQARKQAEIEAREAEQQAQLLRAEEAAKNKQQAARQEATSRQLLEARVRMETRIRDKRASEATSRKLLEQRLAMEQRLLDKKKSEATSRRLLETRLNMEQNQRAAAAVVAAVAAEVEPVVEVTKVSPIHAELESVAAELTSEHYNSKVQVSQIQALAGNVMEGSFNTIMLISQILSSIPRAWKNFRTDRTIQGIEKLMTVFWDLIRGETILSPAEESAMKLRVAAMSHALLEEELDVLTQPPPGEKAAKFLSGIMKGKKSTPVPIIQRQHERFAFAGKVKFTVQNILDEQLADLGVIKPAYVGIGASSGNAGFMAEQAAHGVRPHQYDDDTMHIKRTRRVNPDDEVIYEDEDDDDDDDGIFVNSFHDHRQTIQISAPLEYAYDMDQLEDEDIFEYHADAPNTTTYNHRSTQHLEQVEPDSEAIVEDKHSFDLRGGLSTSHRPTHQISATSRELEDHQEEPTHAHATHETLENLYFMDYVHESVRSDEGRPSVSKYYAPGDILKFRTSSTSDHVRPTISLSQNAMADPNTFVGEHSHTAINSIGHGIDDHSETRNARATITLSRDAPSDSKSAESVVSDDDMPEEYAMLLNDHSLHQTLLEEAAKPNAKQPILVTSATTATSKPILRNPQPWWSNWKRAP